MGCSVSPSLVCFLLLLLAIFTPPTVCGTGELKVLMEIKDGLDPRNGVLVSWTNSGNPCAFEGVACNRHGEVANISLQGKGLSGWIPAAVAGLESLSGLFLHYNNLSGEIPEEISRLTKLAELYLDVNNLSGSIPPQIGSMANLQVLQLGNNRLSGGIPIQMGSATRLTLIALQHNRLTDKIPESLGDLPVLERLDLSFNQLNGTIPAKLADNPQLKVLDVQNNALSGFVPSAFKNLNGGFQFGNNLDLCGVGFPSLRRCGSWEDSSIDVHGTDGSASNKTTAKTIPEAAAVQLHRKDCPTSSNFPRAAILVGSITSAVILIAVGLLTFFHYRRKKQKIGSACDGTEGGWSKDCHNRSPSSLVSLEYADGWGPFAEGENSNACSHEIPHKFRFNVEEVESATQYFSDANLLGRGKFSSVYKGCLRDGSFVAIRSLSVTSCKSAEAEFAKGLHLLTALRHENIVQLRGFCCSRGRGECFLIYDFAPNGNLATYLDVQDRGRRVLDWPTRVSVIVGIAKGIGYLHKSQPNKPAIIHQDISAEKVHMDQHFNPLISDSGLSKLLADDVVFSALKASAAMGYLAPEYVTTGRFTEKSDVYAFGVIILQLLAGKQVISSSMRAAAASCEFVEFIDANLQGNFSEFEAAKLAKVAQTCTHEKPDQRPTMEEVIQELSKCNA